MEETNLVPRPPGTGLAQWGWSGVAELRQLELPDEVLRSVLAHLPVRKSSDERLRTFLTTSGARFHRELHQCEFGPTRADEIAALGAVLERLDRLALSLILLPDHLKGTLSELLAISVGLPASHCSGEEVIERIYEAIADHIGELQRRGTQNDVYLFECLRDEAMDAIMHIEGLDTNSQGDLFLTSVSTGSSEFGLFPGPDMFGEIYRCLFLLREQYARTLRDLRKRKGPDTPDSLRILVWELCALWAFETGQPVTSRAMAKDDYTGQPKSAAGRFVVAAVEALLPPKGWKPDEILRCAPNRGKMIIGPTGVRRRAIHIAIQQFVANHPDARRAGRKRGQK